MQPNRLDRRVEGNLVAVHCKAFVCRQCDEITRGHRTVKLATLGGLPQHREALSIKLNGDLLGLTFER